MASTAVQPKTIILMGETDQVCAEMREFRMLNDRRTEILAAFQSGEASPDNLELLFELGQLNDLLDIAPAEIETGASHG